MRRQSLRIFVLIVAMFGVAAAILLNQQVDLPGEGLDRGGTGPLGLTLGLDLRGGAHLVYQAESQVTLDAEFAEPIEETLLRDGLNTLGLASPVVESFEKQVFSLDMPGLSEDDVDAFVGELANELVAVTSSSSEAEERSQIHVSFQGLPSQSDVGDAVRGLGYEDALIAQVQERVFIVSGLPGISEEDGEELGVAMEELYPLDALELIQTEDGSGAAEAANVFFQLPPNEAVLSQALDELEQADVRIVNVDGKNFTAILPLMDDERLAELLDGLAGELDGLEQLNTSNITAALVDVVFTEGVDPSDMLVALDDLGYSEAAVVGLRGREYVIRISELADERDATIESEISEQVSPLAMFSLQREDPTTEQMEGIMDTIQRRVDAFGITEPSVQRFGEQRVLVQLPGVEDTVLDITFKGDVTRGSLENALDEAGYGDAIVGEQEIAAVPSLYQIAIPDVTEENREEIRDTLEENIGPPVQYLEYDEALQSYIVSFQPLVQQADVETNVGLMGYEDAVITPAPGSLYQVRLPTIGSSEQGEIEAALSDQLRPVYRLEASGGVEEAKQLIGETAQLVFAERTCLNPECTEFEDNEALGPSGEPVTGDNLVQAYAGSHPTTGLPIVNFVFDGDGTRIFRDFTTRIAGDNTKCIAHILDGQSIICPVVPQAIVSGTGFIEGPDFTFDRVRTLAIQLESGSLPVSLDLVRESTVDSFLGNESLRASLQAGAVGLGLIVLFMILYYRAAGLVAAMALIVYATLALAVFKMTPVTLTLSGLAALILSVGMAVDANILIFERLKEELRAGRSLLSSMEIGFRRAWPAIRDSNTSTFITCGILFFFGRELGEPRITGFSITLAVGVAVSMFTALTVSRNFLQLLAFTPLGNAIGLFSPEGRVRRDGQS